MSTVKVPPLSEQLQFAKNEQTGRVHILTWYPRSEPIPFAEIVLSTRVPVLCGVDLWHPPYVAGDGFPDEDLCVRCVKALGDQQWRAFHVDNRGPDA